jgi:hypothetical protein
VTFIDLPAVQTYFKDCDGDLTFDLPQALAHELGHAHDIIFNRRRFSGKSVDFENVLRPGIKRRSEFIRCACQPR